MTNVEEDANESKGRNNRRSSSKLGNGFGGGGSSVQERRTRRFLAFVRTERVEVDICNPIKKHQEDIGVEALNMWVDLFAAILIGFPLSNAVFFFGAHDAKVMGIVK